MSCSGVVVAGEMLWNANANNDDKGPADQGPVQGTSTWMKGHARSTSAAVTVQRNEEDVQSYAVQMALTIYTQPSHRGSKMEIRQKWYIP
jgi:hypothetical protein